MQTSFEQKVTKATKHESRTCRGTYTMRGKASRGLISRMADEDSRRGYDGLLISISHSLFSSFPSVPKEVRSNDRDLTEQRVRDYRMIAGVIFVLGVVLILLLSQKYGCPTTAGYDRSRSPTDRPRPIQ